MAVHRSAMVRNEGAKRIRVSPSGAAALKKSRYLQHLFHAPQSPEVQ
jgi:hypothetical protein